MNRPADARTRFDAIHNLAVFHAADDDVIFPLLGIQPAGPVVAGRLHDDDPADVLPLLVAVMNEQIGKGPQEPAGAELQDRLGQGHGMFRKEIATDGTDSTDKNRNEFKSVLSVSSVAISYALISTPRCPSNGPGRFRTPGTPIRPSRTGNGTASSPAPGNASAGPIRCGTRAAISRPRSPANRSSSSAATTACCGGSSTSAGTGRPGAAWTNRAASANSAAGTTAGPTTSPADCGHAGVRRRLRLREGGQRPRAGWRRRRVGAVRLGASEKPGEPVERVPRSVARVGRVRNRRSPICDSSAARVTTSPATGRCTSITTSTAATT